MSISKTADRCRGSACAAQVKADMRGHVAELLAKSVKNDQLDQQLNAGDKRLLLDYLATKATSTAGDLRYKGRSGPRFRRQSRRRHLAPDRARVRSARLSRSAGLPSGQGLQRGAGLPDAEHHVPAGRRHGPIARAFEKRVGRHPLQGRSADHPPRREQERDRDLQGHRQRQAVSRISADYCLCAIPLSVLRMIDTDFPTSFKDAVKAVAYAPVGKIGLQMKRRFWEEDDHIYGGHVLTDLKGINTISVPSSNWQKKKGVLLGYYNYQLAAIEVSA
jgi:monoamine oxidase